MIHNSIERNDRKMSFYDMINRFKEFLLLNAYAVENTGLMYGKAGIALTLFELSRYCNDESLEKHGLSLLQEALIYNVTDYDYCNGKAGIAYAIHYLIKNDFLEADYMDLYGEKHEDIVNSIIFCQYKKQDLFKYVDDLFFIKQMADYIQPDDYERCINKISENICYALESFDFNVDIMLVYKFYEYSVALLTVFNSFSSNDVYEDKFIYLIKKKQIQLDEKDFICTHPQFPIQICINEMLRGKRELPVEYLKMLRKCMQNVVIPTLSYRDKTNLVLNLYKLDTWDNIADYRAIADEIFGTLIDKDLVVLEEKMRNALFINNKFSSGIYGGISRLILLCIYYEEFKKGNFSEYVVGLFN